MTPVNLNLYRKEVEAGLPNECKVMDDALERQAFYDYEGFRYERHFRRDSESTFDFQGRSKRSSGFLRECIEKLCSHLYTPGPARAWSEAAGDEFLQEAYQDNLIDSLMLECDKLSTLNSVVAIQIDPVDDDPEKEKPIVYRVWGREQFCVWTDPDSASTPIAVCTKDKYDTQIRYRLWSDTEVWTFLTKKGEPSLAGGMPTSGGRVAYPVTPAPEPHGYGCLPFTFVHYSLPIRDFEVVAAGEFLWKAEIAIDDRLSRLDETIHKHLNPIPIAENVPIGWRPEVKPMRFIALPSAEPTMGASGYEPGRASSLSFLEAHIDVAGAWEDLKEYVLQCLEAVGIPRNSIKMEPVAAASGISLMIEQEPLIKRAETRRAIFKVYEEDLAKRTLTVGGNHYGRPELVAEIRIGHLAAGWPPPRLAVMTQDLFDLELLKVQNGVSSHLQLVQQIYGCTRDEALELLKRFQEDNAETEKLFPEAAAATAPTDPKEEAEKQHEHELQLAKMKGSGKK